MYYSVRVICFCPTAFFDYKDDGTYPKPPSYNVATSLPSYDEAERTKAESSVPLMPTRVRNRSRLRVERTAIFITESLDSFELFFFRQDEDFAGRDDFDDVDQLRVGNDGIFMLTFFSKKCIPDK